MSDVNEFNAEINDVIFREYTPEELEVAESDRSGVPQYDTVAIPENTALVSAMVKLQSLGLTTDEAKALLGL